MRVIPIEEAEPRMKLAKPIYRVNDGRILLQAGLELTELYIEKLKHLKYTHIAVQEIEDKVEILNYETIKEATRNRAAVYLKNAIRQVQGNQSISVEKLKQVVREVIDQVLADSQVVYNLIQMRVYDKYLYNHSINVCIISLLVGMSLGLFKSELESLGTGALLHDIGKLIITEKILNKKEKLNPREYEVVKQHARHGYEILKTKANLSFLMAHVALQHHEREDGSGYPKGLSGNNIHRFAKIAAVADVFDAMTTRRPFQNEVPAYIAIKEIRDNHRKFDPMVIQHFIKVVAPYPIGSVLLLNNGQNVAVTSIARDHCLVKVTNGPHEGKTYNLFQSSELKVIAQIR